MKKHKRTDIHETSVSFLDVISCGFGAIVLLLIIARVGDPSALEEAEQQLMGSVKELQTRLFGDSGRNRRSQRRPEVQERATFRLERSHCPFASPLGSR